MAPALSISHAYDLKPYLEDLLETITIKRIERYGSALEPGEGLEEMSPMTRSMRFARDVDKITAHFKAGEELFEAELPVMNGFGDAMDGKSPNMHRVHRGAHGGPDTSSCRSCHHRGGDDGAGEYTEAALTGGDGKRPASANERNPPHLQGGGAVQILAHEITAHLRSQLAGDSYPESHKVKLSYQGVDFGEITVNPDGSRDTSALKAIDPDLVVRPFGWKGTHSTLRRFAEEAFQVHHGLQSTALVDSRVYFDVLPRGTSPATRALFAALGENPEDDPDGDKMRGELAGVQLAAIATYLTLLPLPVIEPPRAPDLLAAWRQGITTFGAIGCESCHKPSWIIKNPVWTEYNEGESSKGKLEMDLRKDIQNGTVLRNWDSSIYDYPIFLFSDLRRHDMGEELADRPQSTPAGGMGKPPKAGFAGPDIPRSYFLTRPLWGLADSAPYLHDGRALTIHDAIVMHGGEAKAARDAYAALPVEKQRAIQVFLYSLARAPLPEVSP